MSSFLLWIVSLTLLIHSSIAITIETDDPILRPFIIVPGDGKVMVDPTSFTDFPTPPPVITTAPTPWPTVVPTPAPPQNYILFEKGDAKECPTGTSRVDVEQCLDAAQYLRDAFMGPKYSFPYYLNTNPDYGAPPCGCFLRVIERTGREQILPEYNTAFTGCGSGPRTRLICQLDYPLPPNTAVDMTQWNKAYASGALIDGTEDATVWSNAVLSGGDFYIRRLCTDCVETHQDIIYHRKTPLPAGMNVEQLFLSSWTDVGNTFHTDFELYSNMPYALLNFYPWTYCNFVYDNNPPGFPRDCGPNGNVTYQWNSVLGPDAVGAILYTDDNLQGLSTSFTAGDYNYRDFLASGFPNDELTSISVKPGFGVWLYQHSDYRGWSAYLPAGDYELSDMIAAGAVNDDVSSIKVHPVDTNSGVLNYAYYVWGGTYSPGDPADLTDIEACRNDEECGHDPSKPYYMDYIDGNGNHHVQCLNSLWAQTRMDQGYGCGTSPDWATLLDPCYSFESCIGQPGPYYLSYIDGNGYRKDRCFDRQMGKVWAVVETTYCAATPAPTPSQSSAYSLSAMGEGGECPTGQAVPQNECLEASYGLRENITISQEGLNVINWDGLPCGCFFWFDTNDGTAITNYNSMTTNCNSMGNTNFQMICYEPIQIQLGF